MVTDEHTLEALYRLLAADPVPYSPDPGEGIAWLDLAILAEATGVAPLLYSAVQQGGMDLPEEVQAILMQAYYRAASTNAVHFQELERVLGHLETAGLPTLLLKGAALASTVYDNVALRPMGDLDILVPRNLVTETSRLLQRLGYQTVPGPPGHSFAYDARFGGEIELLRTLPTGVLALDLHWHLLAQQWLHHATRINMDVLWQDAQPLRFGSLSTLQLSPEDTLLHLCLHAAYSHAYAHLLNLVDIDRTVRACANLSWDRFLARVEAFEVRVPVHFGLQFAHDLLSAPVPEWILTRLRPKSLRRRLVARSAGPRRILSSGYAILLGEGSYALHLALIDGLPGWARLARFVLQPGDAWLAERYALTEPLAIRMASIWHPFRALAASLSGVSQRSKRGGRYR